MTMPLSWDQVHRIALREAARVFLQLGIDQSQRIDPFAALEAHEILVVRRPLHRLAGLYLPAAVAGDGRPGVLINVNHPLSKQRFTAAHELAHHRRDRQTVFDEETEWIARGQSPSSDRERIAEAFAAWFLMPKRLVEQTIKKLGVQIGRLDAAGAYALALELGTSYAATVHHLTDMHLLVAAHRDRLLKTAPQAIKRSLGAADVAADAWRDVWLVHSPPSLQVDVQEGDAVVVEVPEVPSSGYLWQPAILPEGLALMRDEYREPDGSEALGSQGAHRFLFRVEAPGSTEVRLELRRPWQQGAAPAEECRVEIIAEPRPAAGVVNPRQLVTAGA
jgi:Zn-dependent peptidase ImmA (M78 family)/predicted secreted protein